MATASASALATGASGRPTLATPGSAATGLATGAGTSAASAAARAQGCEALRHMAALRHPHIARLDGLVASPQCEWALIRFPPSAPRAIRSLAHHARTHQTHMQEAPASPFSASDSDARSHMPTSPSSASAPYAVHPIQGFGHGRGAGATGQTGNGLMNGGNGIDSVSPFTPQQILRWARQIASALTHVAAVATPVAFFVASDRDMHVSHPCIVRAADVLLIDQDVLWLPYRTRDLDYCTEEPELLPYCPPEALWQPALPTVSHGFAPLLAFTADLSSPAFSEISSPSSPFAFSPFAAASQSPSQSPSQPPATIDPDPAASDPSAKHAPSGPTDPGAAVSVYAFGVFLWELWTGHAPPPCFDRTTHYMTLDKGLRLQIPDHVPQAWRRLLTLCWASNPAHRPTWLHIATWFRPQHDPEWFRPPSRPKPADPFDRAALAPFVTSAADSTAHFASPWASQQSSHALQSPTAQQSFANMLPPLSPRTAALPQFVPLTRTQSAPVIKAEINISPFEAALSSQHNPSPNLSSNPSLNPSSAHDDPAPKFPSMQIFDPSSRLDPDNELSTFDAAQDAYNRRDLGKAMELLTQAAQSGCKPAVQRLMELHQDHETLLDFGMHYFETREYEAAHAYMQLCLQKYEDFSAAHLALGLLYAEYPRIAPTSQTSDVHLRCRRRAVDASALSRRDSVHLLDRRTATELRQPTARGAAYLTLAAVCKRVLMSADAEAHELYLAATLRGQLAAEYELGLMHRHGLHGPRDYRLAVQHWRSAAARGHAAAQCALADLNYFGVLAGIPAISPSQVASQHGDSKTAGSDKHSNTASPSRNPTGNGDATTTNDDNHNDNDGASPARKNIPAPVSAPRSNAEDEQEAVRLYLLADQSGASQATYALGCCYEHGRGVPRDLTTAVHLYLRSAQEGCPDAQTALGLCYLRGVGVPQDQDQAHYWLRIASDQGMAPAAYHLAMALLHTPDRTPSVHALAQTRSSPALVFAQTPPPSSSPSTPDGKGAPGNGNPDNAKVADTQATNPRMVEAFRLFIHGASQLHLPSQYRAALCLLDGIGVEQDVTQALDRLRFCGEQGHVEALARLGDLHHLGTHAPLVPQDHRLAAEWYLKAADIGHSHSQRMLADMYVQGLGVRKDLPTAIDWYLRAGNQKHNSAVIQMSFQDMASEFCPTYEFRLSKSHVVFDTGDREAQFQLGTRYMEGKGVIKDVNQAFDWYKLAANQGHPKAMRKVGDCFAKGLGTMRNLRSALSWYEKAAAAGDPKAQAKLDRIASSSPCLAS
eukprot:TRINITY_DN3395_c0_g1_i3.p1 TRINITY_DN3395_c0_g1~~TRINITY_DN3395_c0_g1_i3.p1  ORF type:complete len:1278 (-),score=198.42 TRINITY_DN3395_c0_g1_i3:553-4386(-)